MPKTYHLWSIALITILSLTSCKTYNHISNIETERVTVSDETQADVDDRITVMIEPYKRQLDAKMDEVIGVLETDLEKKLPQGSLNNWMTDIIHDRANAYHDQPVDFSIQNYGGIRVPKLAKGDVVVRDIYELMPFDNEIVILELDHGLLIQMIDHMADGRGWPVSKELRMTITADKKAKDVTISGEPIDPNRTYRMAIPDYVANGGGGCDFLKPIPQAKIGWNVREAIIDYLRNHNDPMSALLDGRITKEQ